MSEYIKREDALRKIDSIDDHDDDVRANALGLAAFAVTTVPSADVVEVVRCKECKYWDNDCRWCDLWGDTQEYADAFCSYGERKDDND